MGREGNFFKQGLRLRTLVANPALRHNVFELARVTDKTCSVLGSLGLESFQAKDASTL